MNELESIASILVKAQETQELFNEAMRLLLARIVRVEDELGELRDELLALANRIEAVTQLATKKAVT